MSKASRRRQLIESALEVFSKRGFAETTTKEIAAAAGVSEGIIYHHFPTKEAVYTSILDHIWKEGHTEEWLQELHGYAEQDEDEALICSVVSKILESYRENRSYQRMMLDAALRGHEIAKLANERLGLPIFEFLRGYVSRRQSVGAFRKGDPGMLVLALVATPVYYSMVTRLFGVSVPDLERPDEELVPFFTKLAMDGVLARSEGGATR
jgi:TetR/AcrR family transcriptional regulator